MKTIEIKDFIVIKILELNEEQSVCFVDSYNEKYFYRDDNNRIYAHQSTYIFYYHLYFQKAKIIYRGHLDALEKAIYKLHKQLTLKIDRAKKEAFKIIDIPNFITIKIVEINNIDCTYYVESYSDEYFYADEDNFLKTYTRDRISFTLTLDIPFTIDNINVEHLENEIYRLHKELTKGKIPRSERKKPYYAIAPDFTLRRFTELYDNLDNRHYRACNYFTSESQAREFASKMQEYLMELWKEEMEKK